MNTPDTQIEFDNVDPDATPLPNVVLAQPDESAPIVDENAPSVEVWEPPYDVNAAPDEFAARKNDGARPYINREIVKPPVSTTRPYLNRG